MTATIEATKLLSVSDLAAKLGCSTRQVYRLADRGAMPRPLKLGHLNRWVESTIDAWIAGQDEKLNGKRLDCRPKVCAT
jgi:predicted DNA-binding transcriptional regulator AlpA